jgi:hypothetical protein
MGWASIEGNVSSIFAKLCVMPVFESLLLEWGGWVYVPPVTANGTTVPGHIAGPTNFTAYYEGFGSNPPLYVDFAVQWVGTCTANQSGIPNDLWCSWSEYWTGNTSNDNLTGPFFEVGPVIIAGGPERSQPASFPLNDLLLVGGLAAALVVVASIVVVTRRGRIAKQVAGTSLAAPTVVNPPTTSAPIGEPSSARGKELPEAPGNAQTPTNADPLNDVF